MPSLAASRRIAYNKNSGAETLGQIFKEDADFLMDATWNNDIQSKTCYIYDYFHDDFLVDKYGNTRALKEGMTYENTNKTKIDIKFIIKSYQSMDKDEVEHYIQFKPSQKMSFQIDDELHYYETNYRQRYLADFPIGLYIDIPDSKKVYHKWLICRKESANQFPKYLVLPIDYELMWVEQNANSRIKRRMWAVSRNQQSYTSGIYRDRYFAHTDNQNKIWLPMNSITERIWYTGDDNRDTRLIISALIEHPNVWKVTKVENTTPLGLQKLTIYSDFYNEHTDYVNLETGEMYADYYDSDIVPSEADKPATTPLSTEVKISTSTPSIKVGGNYKTLKASVINSFDENFSLDDYDYEWSCFVRGEDFTDRMAWKTCDDKNQIKVKFPNDANYLGDVIKLVCLVKINSEIVGNGEMTLEIA